MSIIRKQELTLHSQCFCFTVAIYDDSKYSFELVQRETQPFEYYNDSNLKIQTPYHYHVVLMNSDTFKLLSVGLIEKGHKI